MGITHTLSDRETSLQKTRLSSVLIFMFKDVLFFNCLNGDTVDDNDVDAKDDD